MKKSYQLDGLYDNLFNWVEGFKPNAIKGDFSLIRGNKKPSLYGICDMVFNLFIPDKIENYIDNHEIENKDAWIKRIQSYQDPKTGFPPSNY
ncbi:MAG: hypothetical protein P8Y23_11120 [Candidatus Lokiarchaeota archaeon]